MNKYIAEAFGTGVLVLLGCGSAVLAGGVLGGTLGIAFAFGLAVVAMAYTIGHISGCHINPAITIGMCVSGRMTWAEGVKYMIAQTIGAIIGAAILAFLATNGASLVASSLGQNSYSANNISLLTALVAEFIATFIFVKVVLSTTKQAENATIAGLVIGLTLVLIHIVFIPLTGTSVNPARTTGPALLVGGTALAELWVFWVAPLLGGIAAGLTEVCCKKCTKSTK